MRFFVRAALIAVCVNGVCGGVRSAEEAAAAPASSWKELIARRDAIIGEVQEIQLTLRTREVDNADELRQQGRQLLAQLFGEVLPALRTSAATLLKKDMLDEETQGQILEVAYATFQENKFPDARTLAEAIVAKYPENADAINLLGASAFAMQDFTKAAEVLTAADKEQRLTEFGSKYIDSAQNYIGYWKTEQAIREKEAALPEERALPRVVLHATRGDIVLELFEDEAPNSVANFISLVEKKFYDGTRFHRVINGFMAQGGDPNSREGSTEPVGSGGPGYRIKCECYAPHARRHFAGTLSMAHAGRDSGGSQFFITHLPTPHLDKDIAENAHTVFGRVVEGMDVVHSLKVGDTIESAEVVRKRNHEYQPETLPEKTLSEN